MPTFKFWSDTSLQNCRSEMDRLRFPYEATETTMTVEEEHSDILFDHGAERVSDPRLEPQDNFQDISAFSTRSNPPEVIRGPSPQEILARIARTIRGDAPSNKTKRRSTRSQPL